jgi:hypothetical protein
MPSPEPSLNKDQAKKLLTKNSYINYIQEIPINIDFSGSEIDTKFYS